MRPPIANNQKKPTPKCTKRTNARLTLCSLRCSKLVIVVVPVIVIAVVKIEIVVGRISAIPRDDEVDGSRFHAGPRPLLAHLPVRPDDDPERAAVEDLVLEPSVVEDLL